MTDLIEKTGVIQLPAPCWHVKIGSVLGHPESNAWLAQHFPTRHDAETAIAEWPQYQLTVDRRPEPCWTAVALCGWGYDDTTPEHWGDQDHLVQALLIDGWKPAAGGGWKCPAGFCRCVTTPDRLTAEQQRDLVEHACITMLAEPEGTAV